MYQLIYRAGKGCRDVQKYVNSKDELLSILRSFAVEPIYCKTQVVSIHQIVKTGAYLNGRRYKRLDAKKLTTEAIG